VQNPTPALKLPHSLLSMTKGIEISGVRAFILFRMGFRNSGCSLFKTATMRLFSFPQTLSRAHDPKRKKREPSPAHLKK